ncbi:hypothetical protein OPT61_g6759 [Boeremia exigua]|uniref:Uncharacterized protein n=1 Tax=Boeremia exigua TaxID=749465 RepID=A0ACC2I5G8_9PLEO|nr:hypothetical protein OPT61_g6759 [Boeremia exigua]
MTEPLDNNGMTSEISSKGRGDNSQGPECVSPAAEPVLQQTMSTLPACTGLDIITSLYQQATEADRLVLLEMNKLYFKDNSFRESIKMSVQKSSRQPFCFMDLPTELRLMIAQYALQADNALEFCWLDHSPILRRATFAGLEKLNALTRTSKQIYSELGSMVWDINTFGFEVHNINHYLGRTHPLKSVSEYELVFEAIRFLVGNGKGQMLKSISVTLSISGLRLTPNSSTSDFPGIPSLTRMIPHAQWRIFDDEWPVLGSRKPLTQSQGVRFKNHGRNLVARLLLNDHAASTTRNWRIFPNIIDRLNVVMSVPAYRKSRRAAKNKRKPSCKATEPPEAWGGSGAQFHARSPPRSVVLS